MAGIIKRNMRTYAAESLVDELNASPGVENHIYLAIGKETVWPDENLPPAPTDTVDEETAFWDDLTALIKINTNEVSMVVPRINWEAGVEYDVFDPSSESAYDDDFFVLNSADYLYKVDSKSGVGPVTVAEPIGHGGGSPINTGDNYTWQFMYNVVPIQAERFVTNNWMPINWADSETLDQASFGDVNPHRTLGSKWVMFYAKVSNLGIIPTNITYRKTGIIINPFESDGITPATASEYLAANLDPYTGQLLYTENRRPIVRSSDQEEEIRLVVQF